MKEFYEEYWAGASPPPLSDPLAATRQRLLWRYLARAMQGPIRLLDAGAGIGTFVEAACGRGLDACGIEVSETAIGQARNRDPKLRLLHHSVEDVPWPVEPAYFDVVTSFEVIEHLLRPQVLLTGARESLRAGGWLALTTPYHGIAKNIAISVLGYDRHYDVTGGHIRFFTDAALRQLLNAEGFDVVSVKHYGRMPLLWAGVFIWARKR